MIRQLFTRFREPDQPLAFYSEWRERAKTFHEAVFGAIESIVLVAALQYGYFKTGSWYLAGLMVLGYAAMMTMIIEDIRYGMHAAFDRFFEKSPYRNVFLWSAGVTVMVLFAFLPTQVSHVIDQLVSNHLMVD